jgi:hypothetical protein
MGNLHFEVDGSTHHLLVESPITLPEKQRRSAFIGVAGTRVDVYSELR